MKIKMNNMTLTEKLFKEHYPEEALGSYIRKGYAPFNYYKGKFVINGVDTELEITPDNSANTYEILSFFSCGDDVISGSRCISILQMLKRLPKYSNLENKDIIKPPKIGSKLSFYMYKYVPYSFITFNNEKDNIDIESYIAIVVVDGINKQCYKHCLSVAFKLYADNIGNYCNPMLFFHTDTQCHIYDDVDNFCNIVNRIINNYGNFGQCDISQLDAFKSMYLQTITNQLERNLDND